MNVTKWRVLFRAGVDDAAKVYEIRGRIAQTIVALVAAGLAGITAAEMSCWAYRLGAYIYTLRHDYGLDIETIYEPHDGGAHGRYILHTAVEILDLHKN